MNIPIIIPVYNQLTYLKNILNWWEWYYPDSNIYIVDNNSTYPPLSGYYNDILRNNPNIDILFMGENSFIPNMAAAVGSVSDKHPYYAVSDPDVMPHPNTPMNFLDIWKMYIEKGYHHVGFNLIANDLPAWLNEKEMIVGNERELLGNPTEEYNEHIGYKAPIDTTFALYTTNNSGWSSPMDGQDWGNSLRLFEAFHLGWFVNDEFLNPEMENYFKTAKYRIPGEPSAGTNNNRPNRFMP